MYKLSAKTPKFSTAGEKIAPTCQLRSPLFTSLSPTWRCWWHWLLRIQCWCRWTTHRGLLSSQLRLRALSERVLWSLWTPTVVVHPPPPARPASRRQGCTEKWEWTQNVIVKKTCFTPPHHTTPLVLLLKLCNTYGLLKRFVVGYPIHIYFSKYT